MQLSRFGRPIEVQKAPAEPTPLADMTWDQFVAWRKAPFTCEWCGNPASHAGSNVVGPWRVHIQCEREAAFYQMRGVMEEARRLAMEGR